MVFGFVILNFLTSQDTVKAVRSIQALRRKKNYIVKIFVVDNGSSVEIYEQLINNFNDDTNIKIIRNSQNVGFAKGNNIGIKLAKQAGCDFITCLNNDVTILSGYNYFEELIKTFENDKHIAVIGPMIVTNDGINQNPFRKEPLSKNEIEYFKRIYIGLYGWLKFWIQRYWLPRMFPRHYKQEKQYHSKNLAVESGEYYALHGSIVVFTPKFFEYYDGFDPGTFLYGEEIILAEMVQQKRMKCFYVNHIRANHAEDVSTDIYLKNKSKEKFYLKNEYNSFRYLTQNYLSN